MREVSTTSSKGHLMYYNLCQLLLSDFSPSSIGQNQAVEAAVMLQLSVYNVYLDGISPVLLLSLLY